MALKQDAAESSFRAVVSADGDLIEFAGSLNIHTLADADHALKQHATQERRTLDLSGLTGLDTPGALFLCAQQSEGKLTHVRPEHQALLDLICKLEVKPLPKVPEVPAWRQLVARLGRGTDHAWRDTLQVIAFVGQAAIATVRALIDSRYLRLAAISRHVEESGVYALPIIGLMAIMISVVIGYQSVAQLRQYGGQDLTIDLVAISVLREMGVLITAIMVAGRSGSAFAAEIGMMKAREEIDALQVLGLKPMELLVVPRLIGLIIALPLLTFFADIMGLAGGAGIAQLLLDKSPTQYMDHVRRAVDGYDLFVGLFKAPVFAFVIGIVGCMHGLRVRGSAESVGRETTAAVVKAIFLVLILDALFSVLFERLGI
jgi:phospholipid/cholesterol/gamma-HCH transport system permease protein